MKLKTRLVVAFLTVVILPVILSGSVIFAVGKYQMWVQIMMKQKQ